MTTDRVIQLAKRSLQVVLVRPRGFCTGVVRGVDIVERALEIYGAPVYVRHEIVHNKHVVDSLRAKGARFVEEVAEIPPGAVTVFSAHGVSRKVEEDTGKRSLEVIDATCPLVSKVHNEAKRFCAAGLRGRTHRKTRPSGGGGNDRTGARQGSPGVECGRRLRVAAHRPGEALLCHPDDAQRR